MVEVTFGQFAWRYFSGQHLDGKVRTNAGWFTRGTIPSDRLTWWTGMPIFSRILFRWGSIAIPVMLFVGYQHAPVVRVNLELAIVLVYAPFLSWRIAIMVVARIPRIRVIHVIVPADQAAFEPDEEMDEVVDAIPIQALEEGIEEVTDMSCVPDMDEIESALRPKGRKDK